MIEYGVTVSQILNKFFNRIYNEKYSIQIENDRISFCIYKEGHESMWNEDYEYQYSFITPPKISVDKYTDLIDAIINERIRQKEYAVAVWSGKNKIHIYLKPFTMCQHYEFYIKTKQDD